MADLVNIEGLRIYVYPDGHMNLAGRDGSYPFNSIAEFGAALMELLRRTEGEARRGWQPRSPLRAPEPPNPDHARDLVVAIP